MPHPKYYADDKAILEEMLRLEKEIERSKAEGVLGAGTIALDAAGLKAAGTLAKTGFMQPYHSKEFAGNFPSSKNYAFDELSMGPQDMGLIDEKIMSQDQIADAIITNTKNEKWFGWQPPKVREAVKIIGLDQNIAKLVQQKDPILYRKLQNELLLDKNLASQKNMSVEEFQDLSSKFLPRNGLLDEYSRSGSGYTGQDILKQREMNIKEANQKLREQRLLDYEKAADARKSMQQGYNELGAASIPFVGGIDMMYNAYQEYTQANQKLQEILKQSTPEQRAQFEEMMRERSVEKIDSAIDSYAGDF